MITKIERVYNVGNFENYDASGNVSLDKMTFIYADNGAGKTTLARILHSLATGDGSIIARHKRIGAAGEPSVILVSDANRHKFKNGSWDNTLPKVAVFDSHFVANNVYSGFEINSEHHKCLYQFVVGDAGVEILKKIERVKDLITDCNSEKSRLAQLIITTTQYNDYEKVLGLSKKPDVDNLIAQKDKELTLAKSQAQIKTQKLPDEIRIPAFIFDYEELKSVFKLEVEGIGKEFLDHVEDHIKQLTSAGLLESTGWVYKGTKLLDKVDGCPFCGQPVEDVALVEGYNLYFSERYKDASNKSVELQNKYVRNNIDNFVLQLKSQYQQVETVMKYWVTIFTDLPPVPAFDIDGLKLSEKYGQLTAVINAKASNPIAPVGLESLEGCKAVFDMVVVLCDTVNQYIKDVTAKITEAKIKIRAVEEVEKEMKALKIYKDRYEQPLMGYCNQYVILNHQTDRLQRINRELQRQQKVASNLLFSQYGAKINDYLQNVFDTPFQIVDVKDGGFRGASRRPNLDYTLTFNGTPIDQGDGGMSNTSFKNVLSEGDKNTIAFSFFLAKLTSDPHYTDKIVVFDDPLTSLDLNRRMATIEQLVKLYGDCKQVIVLSHNIHFLIDLYERKRISSRESKTLRIVNRNGKSGIEEYVIKSEWVDRFKKAIVAMKEFVDNPDPAKQEDAVNSIRMSLETFLKMKFCWYIPDYNMTFGNLITLLKNSACSFVNPNKDDVIDRLQNLDEMSWRTHHANPDDMGVYHEIRLSPDDAKRYVKITLNMLEKEL